MEFESYNMIDSIERVDFSKDLIRCKTLVPLSSKIFDQHFPGYPIVPGVVLTEAMAQSAGFHSIIECDFQRGVILTGIEKVEFISTAVSGDELVCYCKRLKKENSGGKSYIGVVLKNNQVITKAEIKLLEIDYPSAEMKQFMMDKIHRLLKNEATAAALPC